MARRVVCAGALLLAAIVSAGCGGGDPTPAERLAEAIQSTERAKTFTFTLDGAGETERGEVRDNLYFASTGEVGFPDRVQMRISIDDPKGARRSEVRQIKGVVYIRPSEPDAKWQRSEGPMELAGFDPLNAFDFAELRKTRIARDRGRDIMDGVPVHKIRLLPKEAFRRQVESRLPAGFEGTTLRLSDEVSIEIETRRIVRVVQRLEYRGTVRGFFETDLQIERFGTSVSIRQPQGDELSGQPLVVPTIQPRAAGG